MTRILRYQGSCYTAPLPIGYLHGEEDTPCMKAARKGHRCTQSYRRAEKKNSTKKEGGGGWRREKERERERDREKERA